MMIRKLAFSLTLLSSCFYKVIDKVLKNDLQ